MICQCVKSLIYFPCAVWKDFKNIIKQTVSMNGYTAVSLDDRYKELYKVEK
jgi:hypothetical protein